MPVAAGTSCASNVTEMFLRAGTARPDSKVSRKILMTLRPLGLAGGARRDFSGP